MSTVSPTACCEWRKRSPPGATSRSLSPRSRRAAHRLRTPARSPTPLTRTVEGLRAAGAQVLTMRLPDPGQMFGLPKALGRPLARRMRAVNQALDEVALRHGTLHMDVASEPKSGNWSRCPGTGET